MKTLKITRLALLQVCLYSSTALTQETQQEDISSETTPLKTITVVGTRTERAINEVAATITIKTNEDVERELARDIADLVRFEPGISVGGTGSRFGLDGFTIRGIGGNRVLTLIDGIRVPEEFSFGPFLSARRDFVDIDSLDRAEIARGPISSLYGSDALGGVVALSTKAPGDFVNTENPLHAGFKLGYSGADNSTVATTTAAAGNDWVSGLLIYTKREAGETENQGSIGGTGPGRELADPQNIDSDNLTAKVTFRPENGHELNFSADYFNSDTDTRILSDYNEISRGTTVTRRDAFDKRERSKISLSYQYQGDLIIADRVNFTIYQQDSESSQLTSEDRITAQNAQQFRTRRSSFDQDIKGAFFQFNKLLTSDNVSHLFSYGLDYYKTDNIGLRDGGTLGVDGAVIPEFFPFPTRDFPLTEVEQTALFIQDEINLLNDRLLLSPSIRYDRFEANATADEIYLSGNPGSPLPEDYEDSELTAKIGAVYKFSDHFTGYVRYSEGFRAPPYDDVNVGFSNFIGGYKTISNPDLESETSTGIELGLHFQNKAGSISLAVFQNDYENFIESFAISPQFLQTGGIDPADGLLTFQSINRDEVEIHGAELSGALDLSSINHSFNGFSARAAIAYAQGEDKNNDQPINSAEPLNAVFGLSYSAADDRWGVDLIWTLVERKDQDDIDINNPRIASAGYGIVDLLARMQLTDRTRINLGLFNIGDKSYIRWADTAGIGQDSPARFTQPGFNIGASLRVEL